MLRHALILSVFALTACQTVDPNSLQPPTPSELLSGIWLSTPQDDGCQVQMTFEKGGSYRSERYCQGSGGYEVQAETGGFTADGKMLVLTPTAGSCPGSALTAQSTAYESEAGQEALTLRLRGEALELHRNKTLAGQNAEFGCLRASGFQLNRSYSRP